MLMMILRWCWCCLCFWW